MSLFPSLENLKQRSWKQEAGPAGGLRADTAQETPPLPATASSWEAIL